MPNSALVRFRQLRKVFELRSESNFEAIVARLAPLYEDLRIELDGVSEKSIPSLDHLDAKYRCIYFLRKSLGILWGFAEAIRHLESCPDASQFTPETIGKSVWILQEA